jgi:hypothetical protein
MTAAERPFSQAWLWISVAVFIAVNLLLGELVAPLLKGFVSMNARFTLEGLLNLASYFLGGVAIGVASPGVRVSEPAAGAFLSIVIMATVSLFSPISFFRFRLTYVVVGGLVALFLAMSGAKLGERLTGNKVA